MTIVARTSWRAAMTRAGRWIGDASYLQRWLVLGVLIGTMAGIGAVVFYEALVAYLQDGFALGWESVVRLNEVWRQKPPYSDRYHLFRLVAHLAKYWTSDVAPQIARWAMEVHGALGILAEFPVERWFREAMVLTIWEGTCHRQILDGLEVMERKGAHRLLFEQLREAADPIDLAEMRRRVDVHLALPQAQREAGAEEVFRELAIFTARTVRHAAVLAGV